MAHIVIFDEGATPQKVLAVYQRVNMGDWVDPTTKAPLRSDVVAYVDLSSLDGTVPRKYWKHDAGSIIEMTAGEKSAQDTADAAAEAQRAADESDSIRAGAAGGLDGFGENALTLRAFADIIRDEINTLRALHSLPDRTLPQLRTAITNRVNSGSVDS